MTMMMMMMNEGSVKTIVIESVNCRKMPDDVKKNEDIGSSVATRRVMRNVATLQCVMFRRLVLRHGFNP